MSVILLIVIIAVVVIAAATAITLRRRTALHREAGPEYDRLESEIGPRAAKSEFAKRRQRVDGLPLKELSDERRTGYEAQWTAAQELFIDSPLEAVRSAGTLVNAVAAECGYPVDDESQLLTDLSVYHGRPLDGYRKARRISDQAEVAATEQLRQALLDQRAMFRDLLGMDEEDTDSTSTSTNLAAARPER